MNCKELICLWLRSLDNESYNELLPGLIFSMISSLQMERDIAKAYKQWEVVDEKQDYIDELYIFASEQGIEAGLLTQRVDASYPFLLNALNEGVEDGLAEFMQENI